MSRIFKVNEHVSIVCESKSTRYGFKHVATLFDSGYAIDSAKCCYYNRTWESFAFESVLRLLLEKTAILSAQEKINFMSSLR